jgi:predicted permease
LGFAWGYFGLPREEHPVFAPLFQLCSVLASALTPIAILSVGLMFKMPKLKTVLLPLAVVILIKLLFKPVFIGGLASILSFSKLWKDVLIILAAMPPAILGAVFLKRYGGDAALASTLLLAASVVSTVTVLFVFWFVG